MKNPISPGRGALRAFGIACLLNAALAATAFGQEPILWINFDDESANDLSGNGLNGILRNGAEIVEDPAGERSGMVLVLDNPTGGNPDNRDFVDIIDTEGMLDFSESGPHQGSATVAAWVFTETAWTVHDPIFNQGEWRNGVGLNVKADAPNSADVVEPKQLWLGRTGPNEAVRSSNGVPPGEWTHVAAVWDYDGENTEITFYINGTAVPLPHAQASDDHPEGITGRVTAPAGGNSRIGAEWRGDQEDTDNFRWPFSGRIDDLQVYDAALDQSGIQVAMAGLSLEVEAPISADFGSVRFVETLDRLTEGPWSNPEAINEGDEVYLGEDDTVTSLPAELAGNLAFRPENEVIVTDPLNFSFESPIISATSGETWTNLWDGDADAAEFPGWTFHFEAGQPGDPSAGVQNPGDGFFGGANPLPEPFHENQIGFINLNNPGETVALADSDVIGALEAGQTYTLDIAVGGRATGGWADIEYSIGLVAADGTELGEFPSVVIEPRSDSPGNMVDLNYTLDVDAEAAGFAGDDFFIRLRAANIGGEGDFTQANFDNVRLDPAPETEPDIEITDAGPLGFVVDRDTTVSIAVDENMAVPAWISNGYTNTGATIATTAGNFDVWARDFNARDIVALQGSTRADMDENNHWVILSHGPEAITSSGDNLFLRSAIDSNDWSRGNFHWTVSTAAESDLHEATMLAEIGNVDPEAGMGLTSNIRVPRLQDAGDNAFGFVLLRNPDDPSSSLQAEWLPRTAGGDSTLRLVDVATGSVLDEVTWTGLVPTAVDNDVGVSSGADETVIAVNDPTFPDEVLVPLDEDFEGGATGWTSGSFNSTADQWEIGEPTSGPGDAVSGSNVAATNLDGGYEAESASWLRTPVVDLTGAVEATLTFQEYSDVDTFVDQVGDVFHFVTVSVLDADTLEQEAELALYSEDILEWQERELDLSDFAGSEIVIEFAFFTDEELSNAGDGWYIDDVLVTSHRSRIASIPENLALDGTLNGIATDNADVGNDSDTYLQFTVEDRAEAGNDGVTVYVAWDTRASGFEPDWLRNNFTQTDHFVDLTTGQHRLWAGEYSDGDEVTLGGASAAGSGPFAEGTNNYFVLFGDTRPGLETYYSLASDAVFENGAWNIDFSLTDANGHTQSVSATVEETLEDGKLFGVFARHPDSDSGAVTHAPIWEIDDLSIEFLGDVGDLPGFEAWREEHFAGQLDDPEVSGPEATPAGDGVTNLMKYALDLPPFEPAAPSDVSRLEMDEEGNLVLTYSERTDIDDVEYIPEISEDLITWESGEPQVVEFLRESGDEAHLEDVSVRGQPSENAMKAFLRLTVRQAE